MDTLAKIFPISYRFSDTVENLIIGILIYVFGGAIAGFLIGFLTSIPIIGIVFSLAGSVLGTYCVGGIVISALLFAKVLK